MCDCTRRNVLRLLGGTLTLPYWFPRLAFAAPPDLLPAGRDILVCVFQRGGADGLNLVVPFGDPDYGRARGSLAIDEPGGEGTAIDLDGFFGLHPALAPLHPLWQDGVLAAVHAVGSPNATKSHFDAMDYMERGTPGDKSVTTGWIGRHLSTIGTENTSPFRGVGIGQILQTSLRGPVPATALQSIADFHLQGGAGIELAKFQSTLESLYDGTAWLDGQAQQTFAAVDMLAAAAPGAYQPRNGAVYPESDFGAALLQVAQIIRADIGLEVACVDTGGWDTHAQQGAESGVMANLMGDLAAGLAAFAADMADDLQRITVVVMSEFGRRVAANGSDGTDHGFGGCMLALGGHVVGGKVHGTWPTLAPGALAGPGDLAVTTDFRTVLAEIVSLRLGNANVGAVFPGFASPGAIGVVRA